MCVPAASFPGNQWANLRSISTSPTGNRDGHHVPLLSPTQCLPHTVGWRLYRTLLQTGKLPYPLSHWCLCHWLWVLSSVLRLGKSRACRPAGSSRDTEKLPWQTLESKDESGKLWGPQVPEVSQSCGEIPMWPPLLGPHRWLSLKSGDHREVQNSYMAWAVVGDSRTITVEKGLDHKAMATQLWAGPAFFFFLFKFF